MEGVSQPGQWQLVSSEHVDWGKWRKKKRRWREISGLVSLSLPDASWHKCRLSPNYKPYSDVPPSLSVLGRLKRLASAAVLSAVTSDLGEIEIPSLSSNALGYP